MSSIQRSPCPTLIALVYLIRGVLPALLRAQAGSASDRTPETWWLGEGGDPSDQELRVLQLQRTSPRVPNIWELGLVGDTCN